MDLYPCQIEAVENLKNGSILCGDVGTGKSRTALFYFFTKVVGGQMQVNGEGKFSPPTKPRDLFIITTAKKRDSLEWDYELIPFNLNRDVKMSICNIGVIVDSWQNIKKYSNAQNAFFIFDEQKTGSGNKWAKAFLTISRRNQWIMLSATPGDKWIEYLYVFLANGFFKSKTEFYNKHVELNPYRSYMSIKRYHGEQTLRKLRDSILVKMENTKHTVQHHEDVWCDYDKMLYRMVLRDHWDPYDNQPIDEVGKYCYLLRKVCNSDITRIHTLARIVLKHNKVIVFYNFNYELEMIKMNFHNILISEWNGQKHEPIPSGDRWMYLVQFSASEGWNCIQSDCIVFFSQSYSYKQTVQAAGRIDRTNTKFTDLYYYHLKSKSSIDLAIGRAIQNKKQFNESAFKMK